MHAEVRGETQEGDEPRSPGPIPTPPRNTAGFVEAFVSLAGADDTGLYVVGSPALGDTSPRQSNLDLVAVTPAPLADADRRRLLGTARALRVHGRDPVLCFTTWEGLAGGPEKAPAMVFAGRNPVPRERLANPMTWSILAGRPVALHGPAAPEVLHDPQTLRSWSEQRLPEVVGRAAHLLWRRQLTRVVLESTRCARAALTGTVLSLRDAGEWALPVVSHTGHRVITDALGYREGANTSMYWGPFERKSNAVGLGEHWLQTVRRGG